MVRGARRPFKMVAPKILSGYLNTWMILVALIARTITTIHGHGHLIRRFSG